MPLNELIEAHIRTKTKQKMSSTFSEHSYPVNDSGNSMIDPIIYSSVELKRFIALFCVGSVSVGCTPLTSIAHHHSFGVKMFKRQKSE